MSKWNQDIPDVNSDFEKTLEELEETIKMLCSTEMGYWAAWNKVYDVQSAHYLDMQKLTKSGDRQDIRTPDHELDMEPSTKEFSLHFDRDELRELNYVLWSAIAAKHGSTDVLSITKSMRDKITSLLEYSDSKDST